MPGRPSRPVVGITVLVTLVLSTSTACRPKKRAPALPPVAPDYTAELPPGMMALRKIPPERWPTFSLAMNDTAALRQAIDHSLTYLAAPSSRQYFPYLDIDHARATASLHAMRAMVEELGPRATGDPAALNALVRERFEVYQSVGAPDPARPGGFSNDVLFTGYFTPIYPASLTQTPEFRYPLYQRPPDLQSDPVTGDVNPPYLTRRQVEREGALAGKGLELVWLKDAFDAYVITVQGSARLKLTDGRTYEVGYAGHNGHPYTAPAHLMVRDGAIRKQDLSLKTMREYFRAHPQDADKYLLANDRYVFFTERPGGPFGSLNVPVTALHTIATDKGVYPRAMPAFVVTQMAGGAYAGFMLDQDTGGAIRAAGRCDIYVGIGPQAEATAGRQLHAGQLYYLAVRPELVEQYAPAAVAGAE